MAKIFNSFDSLIGNTPLFQPTNLSRLNNLQAKLLLKLEYFNPAGSVKDRVAVAMIEDAEKRGILKSGSVIIEPTSGNTGIGLAAAGGARGYRVILTMPEKMSIERRKLLKAYGAEIVLTQDMQGAIKKANELLAEIPSSVILGQFTNERNVFAHYSSTGPEIWKDTDGKVDIFVAGVGTGGTISGVGKYLKEQNPNIQIIAVEPTDSPVLSEGRAGSHGLQGIGAGFVPDIYDGSVVDKIVTVSLEQAFTAARALVKNEGILTGISSGAALAAGLKIAGLSENKGKTIVTLLPDSGEKYLSTPLYDY